MLRLWNDTARVAIYSDRLVMARYRRSGFRRFLVDTRCVRFDDLKRGDWHGAINVLHEWASTPVLSGAETSVEIASEFVQFLCLRRDPAIRSNDELAAFIEQRFTNAYGEDTSPKELRWTALDWGGSLFAARFDVALLDGIRQCFVNTKPLCSVQPLLSSALNRLRKALAGGPRWIVVIESRRVSLVKIIDNRYCDVKAINVDAPTSEVVASFIEREMMIDGLTERGRVLVCALVDDDGVFRKDGEAYQILEVPAELIPLPRPAVTS